MRQRPSLSRKAAKSAELTKDRVLLETLIDQFPNQTKFQERAKRVLSTINYNLQNM
jgi:hypothetical protein